MGNKTSGARYLTQMLLGYGITHVFYVEAILRRTLVEMERAGIRRVLTHSEKAAAYMADGYARAGNRPGLCMAQSVGAANLAAGLQDACLGHSPVIAFTGRKPPLFQYRNAYQEILHNRMFDPVTKYNVEVSTLEQVPHLLAQAFREASSGAAGPVHLDFLGYEGDLTDQAEAELLPIVEAQYGRVPPRRPAPDPLELEHAVEALGRSRRPVLVVGRGAVVSGAHREVAAVAEALGAAVACSVDGKEILPDEHPLFVGPVGTYCRPCANRTVAEADLVFFVGCGAGDQVTKNWTLPPLGSTVLQLDLDPRELGRNYPGTVGILGDAETGLRLLRGALERRPAQDREPWKRRVADLMSQWRSSVCVPCESDQTPIRTERLCAEITAWLPDDAVVVADTGYSAIWAGTLINLRSGSQKFLRASGSLGWAFPASLGAKCALPERPVVCFSGDGAFWYHFAELETAVRWDIPTVTVINNNSVLGQSQLGIRRAYRQQYRFRDTNFARLAEDLGAVGLRVERPDQIRPALQQALASKRPAVVDVVTEPESHPVLS
jgi:acetolactate synthase-1/2/3 large subunit